MLCSFFTCMDFNFCGQALKIYPKPREDLSLEVKNMLMAKKKKALRSKFGAFPS